jgi:predicted glycoside hydrolase/deacetylase ChbG (UPF0249 family)
LSIILTADDFGFSDDTVDATIDCFERGIITGASIMANMPSTHRAVNFAKEHPEFSFGVHITLVGEGIERPLMKHGDDLPLVDENGLFIDSSIIRLRAILGFLSNEWIEKEIRAQIDFILDAGINISYIDSHKHMHKYYSVREALKNILPDYGINKVRNAQNIYLRKGIFKPTYWFGKTWGKKIIKSFISTENFYMPTATGDKSWSDAILDKATFGNLEIGIHPGFTEGWRVDEMKELINFVGIARNLGIKMICWDEI